MGNNISAILAILIMDKIERQVINNSRQMGCYKRYADDICILKTDTETAEAIFEQLNTRHQCIKFEIEHPDNDNFALSLLDFTVKISDGQRDPPVKKKRRIN